MDALMHQIAGEGFLARLLAVLIDAALKGTVVLVAAGLLATLLKRKSAAVRHLVWSVAVGAVLALPIFCAVIPAWRLPVLPAETAGATDPSPFPQADFGAAGRSLGSSTSARSGDVPPSEDSSQAETGAKQNRSFSSGAWLAWVVAVWAIGGIVAVAGLLAGTIGMWRLVGEARPAKSSAWKSVQSLLRAMAGHRAALRESDAIRVPVTWGVVKPVVLMPQWARDWPEQKKRIALLHEVAHLRRLDCLTQVLAQLSCGLFWFHPLVWYAARRMRIEREHACDDRVLDAGLDPSDYAGHILDIARSARGFQYGAVSAVFMAHQSSLEGRLLAILDGNRPRLSLKPTVVLTSVLLAAAALLPLAALRAGPRVESAPTTDAREAVAEEVAGTGQSAMSPYSAVLPNGSRVELVGISYHPSRWREWWSADGTPLEKRPYAKLASEPELPQQEGSRWMQVAIRVRAPEEGGMVTYCETLPEVEASGSRGLSEDGQVVTDVEARLFRVPESRESITVRYAVSGGAWDTAAVTQEGGTTTQYKDGEVRFSRPFVDEGGDRLSDRTGIVVTDTLTDDLPRILAIDRDGKPHLPATRENVETPPTERATRAWWPALPFEELREFQFQVRPYEWVVFRNVSLRPGRQTEVEVDVRGEAGEEPIQKSPAGSALNGVAGEGGMGDVQRR